MQSHAAERTIWRDDCRVVDPSSERKESVTWSGACKEGYAEGSGVLAWTEAGRPVLFEGTLQRGRASGHGYMKDADETEYEGGFTDWKREGKGIRRTVDRNIYEGDWKADYPHGDGKATFALGGRYEGQFQKGHFHGKGKATYIGGRVHEGMFLSSREEGRAPRLATPEGRYSLDSMFARGSILTRRLAGPSVLPFDKTYAELTDAQKDYVRSFYALLDDADEPPYPLLGTKAFMKEMVAVHAKLYLSGPLRMDVAVDAEGTAQSVAVYQTPHPEAAKLMSFIAMKQKYKPATCSGKPCPMSYPISVQFSLGN